MKLYIHTGHVLSCGHTFFYSTRWEHSLISWSTILSLKFPDGTKKAFSISSPVSPLNHLLNFRKHGNFILVWGLMNHFPNGVVLSPMLNVSLNGSGWIKGRTGHPTMKLIVHWNLNGNGIGGLPRSQCLITRPVCYYILLNLIWEFQHVAHIPCLFCQICRWTNRIWQISYQQNKSQHYL